MRRLLLATLLLGGCTQGHGPVAEGVSGPMGAPVPYATAEQLETFARGEQVAQRRFQMSDGLGPAFNVTFCGSCHERPVFGGSAGLYRNFFLAGTTTPDGAYVPAESSGAAGGVIRLYDYEGRPTRPAVDPDINTVGGRNPIPFFGVGLMAEIPEDEILKRADPDDRNNDGISGRPNYDRGFVGRFGVKSQTVSIEGFIRGPLFNHLGITTDPLTDAQKANLPVDSSSGSQPTASVLGHLMKPWAQVAAPDGPLVDDDGVADPEMSTDDLFDLVSWAMLLAAPQIEELTEAGERGRKQFDALGCDSCHTPRLRSPRGNLPVYSDLLIHDMGEELADGIVAGESTGSEFRTQPLWGLSAVGPYLHDGRATTIGTAIAMHGGEGEAAARAYVALPAEDKADLQEFLLSLGGRDQYSGGLIPPDEVAPEAGAYGGPRTDLSTEQEAAFWAGRDVFDFEFGFEDGVGGPRFNGDSCRACHFEPVVGGAGPRGVNVIRHGLQDPDGQYVDPAVGSILHRSTALKGTPIPPQADATIFELRQTPHLFGLGLIDAIDEATILAGADPDDVDGDGISGRAAILDAGRVGRFGWKAQVPNIAEFVRDAVAAELGMTMPWVDGLTFGRITDNDAVLDPEFGVDLAQPLEDYLRFLAPPPRSGDDPEGEAVFGDLGCTGCHTPSLPGADGPVPLYSDLLLHEILPPGPGIEEGSAGERELRTPPLWGVATTAPYLHDGSADTLEQAIAGHHAEGAAAAAAFEAASEADRDALLRFLGTL